MPIFKIAQGRYTLTSASIDDALLLSREFKHATDMTEWGGEGFIFPVQPQQFLLQLYKPDTECFVLHLHQDWCGFGQICQRFGKHHLARLYVRHNFRQQGISYVLLICLLKQAINSLGRLDFSLFVFKQNLIALQCYQRLGFEISIQPGPEHPDLYFMVLTYEKALGLLAQLPAQQDFKTTSFAVTADIGELDVG